MEKEIKKIFELGIGLVGTGMISLSDLILKALYKYLDIPYEEINSSIAFWCGIGLIVLAIVMHILDIKKEKVLAVIGLDTIKSTKKFKNSNIINIIDSVKKLKKTNSKNIITDYIGDVDKCLKNYSDYNVSYFGIAPLPFIALAGNAYRKEKIYSHYEYFQKNDKIKTLNYIPALVLPKLLLNTSLCKDSKIAVVTIETTCQMNEKDLEQFKNCSLYRFQLRKPKTNAIISERQLEAYSEKIADEIYKISKTTSEKIYVLGACQSSLMFEIFRKINKNRVVDIIVCNYLRTARYKYNWGIYASGNSVGKYVELGDVDGKSNN